MNIQELERRISALEHEMRSAPADERIALRPRVRGLIRTLGEKAVTVPNTLANINRQLEDEALEDMFDNMPV
ncbi:hypothetical protein [Sulfitobacter aestuariivivens]|uniref:Uncharacterized protein n=1 Tax=Sulfitobacter aestuariivivens TaxID=2766981 RepID=A0A927D9L7_9RHOB|nr:hypothetical protein [Sulfitobacter aestuariivivens]MBD3665712.1 hypothetical protein [Sulfitobacter aestuariivivens]